MAVRLRKVISGAALTIAAVVDESACPFEKAILSVGRSNPQAVDKLMATLEIAAQQGFDALPEAKLKKLGGGLYEFKEHSAGIRVFGFYDEHRRKLIILHKVWIKAGKDKQQDTAIKNARKEMAQLRKAGLLSFESRETGS